ncbi:MAG: iron ABC transporter permease [Clostridiales bacterium]|nr:iron ABC transporter permease [Clostridiales bacterium]
MSARLTSLRCTAMFLVLIVCFAVLIVLSVNTGSIDISPVDIFKIIFTGDQQGTPASNVIWKIRLPRLLAAAILGGALSVSGFLLQTFFRNPIAGPYVLGISSGAKMFVGIVMIFMMKYRSGVPFMYVMLAAFAGSMMCTGFVLLFARKIRSMSMLLVIGIMLGNICSAVTDFCITFAKEADVANLHAWSMGSFSAVSWKNLNMASAVIFIALIAAFFLSKPISAYQLGEGYAKSMGVNIKFFRAMLITLSSLLSACVTALTGPISFVGIAVPHITKLLFGTAKPMIIIPGAFLCGGVFCMFCDLIARTIFSPTELAISTVTAVFGAPVVIALMLKRQGNQTNE